MHDWQTWTDLAYRVALDTCGDPDWAADCAQEAVLRLVQQDKRSKRSPAGWIVKAARGLAIDRIRQEQRRRRREQAIAASQPSTTAPDDPDSEVRQEITAALAALPEHQRSLLIEHHLLGQSQVALAQASGVNQATISRHLQKAAAAFKKRLGKRGIGVVVGMAWLQAPLVAAPIPIPAPDGRPPGQCICLPRRKRWVIATATMLALLSAYAAWSHPPTRWRMYEYTGHADRLVAERFALADQVFSDAGFELPGQQASLQDWLAAIDTYIGPWNPAQQAAFERDLAALESSGVLEDRWWFDLQQWLDWRENGGDVPRDEHIRQQKWPAMARLGEHVDSDRLLLGFPAWFRPRYRSGAFQESYPITANDGHSTTGLRSLIWFAKYTQLLMIHTYLSDRPETHLEMVDQAIEQIRQTSRFASYDVSHPDRVLADRDLLYFHLLTANRIPADMGRQWCGETTTADHCAVGRLLGTYLQDMASGTSLLDDLHLYDYPHPPYYYRWQQHWSATDTLMTKQAFLQDLDDGWNTVRRHYALMHPNPNSFGWIFSTNEAIMNSNRGRWQRLSATILLDVRAGLPVPIDHADFMSRYADHPALTATIGTQALVYERIDERRFRIGKNYNTTPLTYEPSTAWQVKYNRILYDPPDPRWEGTAPSGSPAYSATGHVELEIPEHVADHVSN